MFNAMTVDEVTLAVADVLSREARLETPKDGYRRSQLLAAYSVARHLAAEQAAEHELATWLDDRLRALLAAHAEPEAAGLAGLCAARRTLDRGDVLARMLASDVLGEPLRRGLHELLRELCDREVEALARASA